MSDQYFSVNVSEAVLVPGLVRTLTHFKIEVTSSPHNRQEADNTAKLPLAPYQASVLKHSRKLCKWLPKTTVERRYSELVDLRTYLVLAYPMIVFPPLPPKTSVDNINTTMQSESHLKEQRRTIKRFLVDLMKMEDVVLYDIVVANALQLPRDQFTNEALGKLRADIAALSAAQAHIDDHKAIQQRATTTTTAALVEGTSRAFRGLFSYMSGTPAVNPYMDTAKAQLGNDPSYTKWLPVLQHVRELQISLSKLAEQFLVLLPMQDEMMVATLNVVPPLLEYNDGLKLCDWFKPLSDDVGDFCALFRVMGECHKADVDHCYTKVLELIRVEAGWMASAEAAIEYLLALFMHVALLKADTYRCGSAETSNYTQFLQTMCTTLDINIRSVTGPGHSERMKLLLKNYVRISISSLDKEEKAAIETQFYNRRLGRNKQSDEEDWAEQLQNLPWKTQ